MKCALLSACAGLALTGAVGFGAGLAWGGAASAERAAGAAIVPVVATMAEEADQRGFDPARVCVQAFSKDLCESFLERGEVSEGRCDEFCCHSVHVRHAPMWLHLFHNPQHCHDGGRCDDVPEKDGRIEADVTYTLRLEDPCQLRGFLEGRWRHHANDGAIYDGSLTGTIGVGTHREFQCQTNHERKCEKCLDVQFIPEWRQWRIGVEASFVGKRVNPGFTPEELRFTLSGDFYADGDERGPYDFGGWRFEGTVDGTHVVYCP